MSDHHCQRLAILGAVVLVFACGPGGSTSGSDPASTTTGCATSTVDLSTGQPSITTSTIVSVDCPPIDPDRTLGASGPMFVCQRLADHGPAFGGVIVGRPGVTSAEEALQAWLEGPTEDEQIAGLEGWDLSEHP